MIKGDGWNVEHGAIAELHHVLADASDIFREIEMYRVSRSPEELRDEIGDLLERLGVAYEMIAEAVADGQGGQIEE